MKCVVYLDWSGSDYGSKNNMYGNMAEGTRWGFYARKQQLLSARLSHRNFVHLSVRLSVCHTGGSVKIGAS